MDLELKEKILTAAKPMFCEYGIKRVSIDDICSELQISKKTFYSVFKQKEELIDDMLKQLREHGKINSKYFDNTLNVIDEVFATGKKFKQKQADNKVNLHYDLEKYYPKIYEKHKEEMKKNAVNVAKGFINAGIAQGIFRKDINMNLMPHLISTIFSQSFEYTKQKRMSWNDVTEFINDVIFRILCNGKGRKYYFDKLKIKD
jgi:AcrR family transcriptional regulator